MQVMLLSVESASDIPVSGVLTFRSGSRKIEILREGKDDKNREISALVRLGSCGNMGDKTTRIGWRRKIRVFCSKREII